MNRPLAPLALVLALACANPALAAAARFNAHVVAAACGSADRARAEAPKATAFLVGHFEKSLASNLGDYIANYDANLQRSGLGHN